MSISSPLHDTTSFFPLPSTLTFALNTENQKHLIFFHSNGYYTAAVKLFQKQNILFLLLPTLNILLLHTISEHPLNLLASPSDSTPTAISSLYNSIDKQGLISSYAHYQSRIFVYSLLLHTISQQPFSLPTSSSDSTTTTVLSSHFNCGKQGNNSGFHDSRSIGWLFR